MDLSAASSRARRRRTLTCTALGAVAALLAPAAAAAAPTATLTPTTAYDAGNRQVGSAPNAVRTYTVRSTGGDPLEIGSVVLSGPDAEHFSLVSDTCSARAAANPLALNQSCTVQVAFAPTAPGARSTTLHVATNGPALASAAIGGAGRDLEASTTTLAHGAWRVGEVSAAESVTIVNRDTAPYTLGVVTISGTHASQFSKTADTCSGATLAGGGSCTVAVAFAPTTAGTKTAALAIASFGPNPVALTGSGVQPAAALAPARRDFGVLAPGTVSDARDLTLTNTGNGPLTLGQAALAGSYAGLFSIASDSCSGTTVAVGRGCAVAVAFAPERGGWRSATLRIPTDVDGAPTVDARLSGRGSGDGADGDPFGDLFGLGAQPLLQLTGDGEDGVSNVASGACDVNGDGYDDVIAGASTWSRTPVARSWEGGAYVRFGGAEIGSADLAAHGDGRVLLLEGEQPGAQTGTGIGCAGDVNGDGIDDLVVGAWAYEYAGRPAGNDAARGVTYVVFGARDLPAQSPLDLGRLGDRGFRVEGLDLPEHDHLGYAATGAGDLDGDGLADLAVMANTADTTDATPARTNNGILYLVPGQRASRTVNVGAPGATLAQVHGASPGTSADPFGLMGTVAALGDVNGDGVGDLGIGSYTASAFGRRAAGAVFAISGGARGRVDLADGGSWLFAVGGAFASHRVGIGLGAAGDVNGDGLADVAIGADSTSALNSDAAYVVFGARGTTSAVIDTADLGARGYRILGGPATSTGYGVDGVGDVDRDGYDDLLVGGYAAGQSGSAWIVHGQPDPTALPASHAGSGLVPANAADLTHYVSLATLTPEQGSRLDGQTAGERFGRSVAGIGDVDGNGANDLAIGSDTAVRRERDRAGEVTVALLPAGAPAYEPEEPGTPVGPGPTPAPAPAPGLGAGTGTGASGPGAGSALPPKPLAPAPAPAHARTLAAGSTTLRVPAVALAPTREGMLRLGTVRCSGRRATRCTVAATVTVRVGGKRWTVRVAQKTLRRGTQARLTATLPRAARTALKRAPRGRVSIRVATRDEDGRRGGTTWSTALRGGGR